VFFENRATVFKKAAFSFAACPVKREACLTGVYPANEKNLPAFLCDLCVLSDHAKAWERAVKVSLFLGLRAWPALESKMRANTIFFLDMILISDTIHL